MSRYCTLEALFQDSAVPSLDHGFGCRIVSEEEPRKTQEEATLSIMPVPQILNLLTYLHGLPKVFMKLNIQVPLLLTCSSHEGLVQVLAHNGPNDHDPNAD